MNPYLPYWGPHRLTSWLPPARAENTRPSPPPNPPPAPTPRPPSLGLLRTPRQHQRPGQLQQYLGLCTAEKARHGSIWMGFRLHCVRAFREEQRHTSHGKAAFIHRRRPPTRPASRWKLLRRSPCTAEQSYGSPSPAPRQTPRGTRSHLGGVAQHAGPYEAAAGQLRTAALLAPLALAAAEVATAVAAAAAAPTVGSGAVQARSAAGTAAVGIDWQAEHLGRLAVVFACTSAAAIATARRMTGPPNVSAAQHSRTQHIIARH